MLYFGRSVFITTDSRPRPPAIIPEFLRRRLNKINRHVPMYLEQYCTFDRIISHSLRFQMRTVKKLD